MALIQEMPDGLIQALAPVTLEEVRVAVATDITLDGRFAREWMVITPSHLEVYSDGETPIRRLQLSLTLLTDVQTEHLIGCGALVGLVRNERCEIVRFSHRLAGTFGTVASYLRARSSMRSRRLRLTGSRRSTLFSDTEHGQCPNCQRALRGSEKVCQACVRQGQVVRRLIGYLSPYRWRVVLVTVLMLGALILNLTTPYLLGKATDLALDPHHPLSQAVRIGHLKWYCLLMLVFGLLAQAIAVWRSRAVVALGMSLTHDLRTILYKHLHSLSLRYFDRRQTGQLISRVTHDTQALESVLTDGVQFFLVNILQLVGITGILLCMNWRLTLLILVPVPIVFIASTLFWPRMIALWRHFHHARGKMVASVNDALSGVRVIKAFARESMEVDRFTAMSRETMRTDLAAEQTWSTIFPFISYLAGLGTLLVQFVGGIDVITGGITLGTLMSFMFYLGMFYGPLQFLSRVSDFLARSTASAARIFEVLDAVPEVVEAPNPVPAKDLRGAVTFQDVWFGYDRHKPALRGLSFAVQPGEMIGLVGRSGAGKSTLINLLCRFYDVDQGSILIDGIDIRQLCKQDLRSQIGVVLQETYLFNGTIAENIAYAKPDAPLEDVMAAAKAANAHQFIIGKPDGYDTMLGERGVGLSGGERQRIAIARAILHDPRILILDEATASVDTDTESQIQEAISRLTRGRTTIAIAHRLSTLRDADRLFVMRDGKLVETGTHEELLARDGEFARLVDIQQGMSQIVGV